MNTITLQDILNQTNDNLSNYNFSNIDSGNKIRGVNRAIEIVQRRLGLPSDKETQAITFTSGTTFYDLDEGFNELIAIYYDPTGLDNDPNTPENKWYIYTDVELLQDSGNFVSKKRACVTNINGKPQLMLLGDNLILNATDSLIVVYWSAYKGTDSTGVTKKILLDTPSDICSFGSFAPDLLYPISLKAATILNPQLRADKDFQSMYRQDYEDVLKVMGRSYPRTRSINAGQTKLQR
jgi:hypothetical protein